jgi:hypothetical protein
MRFIFFCLKIALVIFAYTKISDYCDKKTDKFRTRRIYSNLKFNTRWVASPSSQNNEAEVKSILSQNFSYLGSGGQCWAFLSDDGDYVIKFFKHHRRTIPKPLLAFPLPKNLDHKREMHLAKKQKKLLRDFESYKLAFEVLPKETGTIYVHLNKSTYLNQSITIFDKLNIKHTINLDDVEFVLQKKAHLVHPHIRNLMKNNDLAGASQAIASIINVIHARAQKGVFDEDARIHRNFGFINNQAIIIDVGRLVLDPNQKNPQIIKQDLLKITLRFKMWLERHYPQLVPILNEEIEKTV